MEATTILTRGGIQQAVMNLLSNALRYTPAGGRVWLKGTVEATHGVIRVQDTGVGLSADTLPHIFTLFTRVPSSVSLAPGGMGIGLVGDVTFAAARVVQRSHGDTLRGIFTFAAARAVQGSEVALVVQLGGFAAARAVQRLPPPAMQTSMLFAAARVVQRNLSRQTIVNDEFAATWVVQRQSHIKPRSIPPPTVQPSQDLCSRLGAPSIVGTVLVESAGPGGREKGRRCGKHWAGGKCGCGLPSPRLCQWAARMDTTFVAPAERRGIFFSESTP